MGVVLYKLLTGSCPFTTSNATIMIRNMKNQTINQPNHLSASVKDLFKKIFTIESKRIDMAGLRKHEWTNLEYTGPPDRVYPISNPTCTLNDRVQSIKHTDNTTIYTLYPFFKHYEATCTTTPISVTANKQNSVTQVVENQSKHTNEAQPTEWRSSWVLGSKDWHFLNQPPSQFRAATVGLKLINGNMFDPPTMLQDILSALQTLCSKYELQVKRIPAYYLFLVQVDQQFTIELEIVRLKLKKYGLEIRSKENSSSRFIKDLSDCINWS